MCGQCCILEANEVLIHIFPDEFREICRRLNIPREEGMGLFVFSVAVDPELLVRLRPKVVKGACVFYDRATSKCTIHEFKPLFCRLYPLYYGGVIWHYRCKGWGERGIRFTEEYVREQLQEWNRKASEFRRRLAELLKKHSLFEAAEKLYLE